MKAESLTEEELQVVRPDGLVDEPGEAREREERVQSAGQSSRSRWGGGIRIIGALQK